MPSQTTAAHTALAVACLALFASVQATSARPGARGSSQSTPAPAVTIDVVVVDRDGRFVEGLRPTDFTVTVNGARRPVVSVRRVSRGPGAVAEAASWQAGGDSSVSFAAEPQRTVLVVADQATLGRGEERGLVQAASAFLDRLGLDDRVAVLRTPMSSDAQLRLTTERPAAREVLSRVVGQRSATGLAAAPVIQRPDAASVDADGKPVADTQALTLPTEPADPASVPVPDAVVGVPDFSSARDSVSVLNALFQALGRIPGRKVVAVFSAGLPSSLSVYLTDTTARAAIAARAVVYVFGVRTAAFDAPDQPDTSPLERLATATGGAFAMMGRNPDRVADRTIAEISSCYVLGLDAVSGTGSQRQSVRVETRLKGATVRAAAWLMPTPDAGDRVALSTAPVLSPAPAVEASASAAQRLRVTETRDAASAARSHELQVALARLYAYAEGYERQYSALVAEEAYRQSTPNATVRMRSDLLLVKPDRSNPWLAFRDVFEVNGRPVRDRDQRLQRLFLDPSLEAHARLNAIVEDSSRYNIGAVERTVNVPLYPLVFLRPVNRFRLDVELAGREEAEGVPVWRLRYVEQARPTIVTDLEGNDVPQSGWFLVDRMTGAIVESSMEARRGETTARILVRYRRDPALGLWVPAEMRETYRYPQYQSRAGVINEVFLDGRATYSNFRRFQVKTEETIAVPK
jgi:VWFA-related protein